MNRPVWSLLQISLVNITRYYTPLQVWSAEVQLWCHGFLQSDQTETNVNPIFSKEYSSITSLQTQLTTSSVQSKYIHHHSASGCNHEIPQNITMCMNHQVLMSYVGFLICWFLLWIKKKRLITKNHKIYIHKLCIDHGQCSFQPDHTLYTRGLSFLTANHRHILTLG